MYAWSTHIYDIYSYEQIDENFYEHLDKPDWHFYQYLHWNMFDYPYMNIIHMNIFPNIYMKIKNTFMHIHGLKLDEHFLDEYE